MIIKKCEYCKKELKVKDNSIRFHDKCKVLRWKEYLHKHRRETKDRVNKELILEMKREKPIKVKISLKEYRRRPEVRRRRNKYMRERRKKDNIFKITHNLRNRLRKAIREMNKTGKIMTSKQYGVNYEKIINYLTPFPKDIDNYHVDHIIPLCSFDLTDNEQIKKAFAPRNHQWLLAEENLKKGRKVPKFIKF